MTLIEMAKIGSVKVVEWSKTSFEKLIEWWNGLDDFDKSALLKIIATIIVIVGVSIASGFALYDNFGIKEWKNIDGEVSGCVYHAAYTSYSHDKYGTHSTYHPAYYAIYAGTHIAKKFYDVEKDSDSEIKPGTFVELKYGIRPLSHTIKVDWR